MNGITWMASHAWHLASDHAPIMHPIMHRITHRSKQRASHQTPTVASSIKCPASHQAPSTKHRIKQRASVATSVSRSKRRASHKKTNQASGIKFQASNIKNPLFFTGVHINQDLIWCVKMGVYMGFWVHGGSWLICFPVIELKWIPGIYVPGTSTYTNIFCLIFRLMRYTYFFF